MRKVILACAALALLGGCEQVNKGLVDPFITTLSRIANTATADLQVAQKVALAATPPDQDGFNCAAAALTVGAQVKAVVEAAHVPEAGAFTTAELASLFQPGSLQYTSAQQVLVSGCAGKVANTLGPGGMIAAGGVVGALATQQILPLAAAL